MLKLYLLSFFALLPQALSFDDDDEEFDADYSFKYLFLFGSILLVSMTRHIVRVYELSVPFSVFCLTFGMLWGVGALYMFWMHKVSQVAETILMNLTTVYLPIVVYSIAFCVDVNALMKSITQVLVIAGPVSFISTAIAGLLMRLVIDREWSYLDGLLFGVISLAVYPIDLLHWLQASSHRTKYITILLEGETLITAATSISIYECLLLYMDGWAVYWYQFVAGIARTVLIGCPLGYLFGMFGVFLMKLTYNETVNLMMITIAMCYSTFFIVLWIANAGVTATLICGVVMGIERASLSKEIDESLTQLWKLISFIMNAVLFVTVGVYTPIFLSDEINFKDYVLVIVTYLMANVTRFLSFFLFSPILSRTGYGMTFQNMVICVWGGLKNPVSLNLAVSLVQDEDDKYKSQLFFLHTVGLYMLMLFINATYVPSLLKALGLSEISVSRQTNMNNCMKFIYEARARTIAILKMDRFLSDANWPLVMQSTTLKHPYKTKNLAFKLEEIDQEDEDDEEYLLAYKFTFCPDCQKHVPNEPTVKELREMTKEAKLRILKLKKTAYSRQYENGMFSKSAVRTMHQAVEIAMDSQEAVIELDGLYKLFEKEGIFYRFLRDRLNLLLQSKGDGFRPPRNEYRMVCFRIVTHIAFSIYMKIIILIHMLFLMFYFVTSRDRSTVMYLVVVHGDFFFFLTYLTEFLLKIFALSFIYVWKHGMRTYFRSVWNILEFTILCCDFCSLMFHFTYKFIVVTDFYYVDLILNILLGIRLLRILKLLKYIGCFKSLPTALSKYLNAKVDRHRALAFELGKNYIAGEEEILENLHQIVDNDKIRESVKQRIESDRLSLTKRLGMAQKESPWVTTTVKTKLAMRTVLTGMKDDIYELKISGWVDDVEYEKLLKSIAERYKYIDTLKIIPPPASKMVFRELPYMGDDPEFIEFLYTNVTTKKFDPGEIVFKEGENSEGIYILISGMCIVSYTPNEKILTSLRESGTLPVIDIICSLTYEEEMTEYIVPGNSIGELSTLTGRTYDGVITAETHSQVYVLNRTIIKKAMEMDDDPVDGFECRIWKYISFRRALTVMTNVPAFRSNTQQQIKYILERAFLPNLRNYKVFVINEMMEDIILIEGVVIDFNTRDVYTGPCYIPRVCQRLILPKSSFMNVEAQIETKLMIIPAKDYDEYDIMISEETTCELVNDDSAKCLHHLIQDKASLRHKIEKKRKGTSSSIMKQVRRKYGLDSSKSGITFTSSTKSSKTSKIMGQSRVKLSSHSRVNSTPTVNK